MAELINFVLKSAGCDLLVNEDDINDADNVNGKITDLQEEHQAVSFGTFLGFNCADLRGSKIYPTIH